MTASHSIHVNPDDPRPLYVQIVDEVRRGILRGALPPDAPLPSVRELSRDLKVNPNTVQQAYRELEREGEIFVRRGQGTFVAPGARRSEGLRERVIREVAEVALREAIRAGVTRDELVAALASLSEAGALPTSDAPSSTSPSNAGSIP